MKRFFFTLFLLFSILIFAPVTAGAAPVVTASNAGEADWLTEEPEDDVFSEVTNKVKDTGRSAYKLLMIVGGGVFVISLIAAGVLLMINKNQAARSDTKTWILYICIGGVVIGFALTAVGIFMNIGSSFSGKKDTAGLMASSKILFSLIR